MRFLFFTTTVCLLIFLSTPKLFANTIEGFDSKAYFNPEDAQEYLLSSNVEANEGNISTEINALPTKVDFLDEQIKELEVSINALEKVLQESQQDFNEVNAKLNSRQLVEDGDLEKFASPKVDVSEKESYEGHSYDKDIFDHARELSGENAVSQQVEQPINMI